MELFWYAFSRIQEKSFSPYSVQMCEYTDQNNSEYGHFLHSVCDPIAKMISIKCKSLEQICVISELHKFTGYGNILKKFVLVIARFWVQLTINLMSGN